MFDSWIQDARFALRVLRKSPMFTVTAALSLAIGIGANSTIFSIANAMLFRGMPGIAAADRVVDIGRSRRPGDFDTMSYPNYADVRDRATTLSGVYAFMPEPAPMSLGGREEAERIYGAVVTSNYFTVLGTSAHLGRLFVESDDKGPGANPVVVLSYELWQHRFAADAGLVGRSIVLNGLPFTVLGVAPRGFQGSTVLKPGLWVPMAMLTQTVPRRNPSLFTTRYANWLFVGGRLRDGVSIAQANQELHAISESLKREYPETNREISFVAAGTAVMPGRRGIIAGFLGLLMGIVGLLLLIACVNLAGMLLARGAGRTREVAVRLALGANKWRLVRLLLTETVVVFAIGGAAGLLLSTWLTSLLLSVIPTLPVPVGVDITMDWRVVAFTVLLSLVAAVLCGLAPSLQAANPSLVPALKTESLDRGPARLRLRNIFVVGQVTMSLVLVIGAGLFVRALHHAATVPVGFDQENVDVVALDFSIAGYRGEAAEGFLRDLLGRIRQVPGVVAASAMVDLPLDGGRMGFGSVTIPGVQPPPGYTSLRADWNVSEPDGFKTLGIPIVKGRDFTDADTVGAPLVAVVNETFARTYLRDRDPIGTRFEMLDEDGRKMVTIVGIARDARLVWIGEPAEPHITIPRAQRDMERMSLIVKTSGTSAIPEVRRIVREMNPNLPVIEASPLSEITAINVIPQRIAAAVAGTLGIVGLLLAAIGIYGVTAYAVSRRTREIGIRVALGARDADVMRLLLRQGATLAATGVVIGLLLAAAGSQLIASLLAGISGLDPVTFGGAAILFTAVALLATYLPARRALNVDPMVALRNE